MFVEIATSCVIMGSSRLVRFTSFGGKQQPQRKGCPLRSEIAIRLKKFCFLLMEHSEYHMPSQWRATMIGL
jgi:hypothetical protein